MAIELTTATSSQIDGITDALQITGAATNERIVASKAQLLAAVAEGGALVLRLRSSIILTAPLVIPVDMVIDFGSNMLIKATDATLTIRGQVLAGRWQIFSGFAAGEVVGPFGGTAYPEWWGLTAGYHDLAWNAAIKASAYLDTQLRSHTPGTASYAKTGGHSGLFQNSVYTTAVAEAVESPAFRRGFASQLEVQPPVAPQDPEAFRKKLMGL